MFFTLFRIATLFTAFISISSTVQAAAIGKREATTSAGRTESSTPTGTAEPQATSGAPQFVIYTDWSTGLNGPPEPSAVAGYNVVILSFLLTDRAVDQAQAWAALDPGTRKSMKAKYKDAGIKLLVSAFGATETPTTSKADPIATANKMAAWVKEFDVDGLDIDYEDLAAMNRQDGSAEKWLSDFTKAVRAQLPQGQFIVTHAPLAPWFSASMYKSGAYTAVNKDVGSMIDWYNLQFYNQGATEYTTCEGLLTQSSSAWPKTAVFEMAEAGIPLHKLVIGKPGTTKDATNGFMTPEALGTCLQQAKAKGWSAGAMVWQYSSSSLDWIKGVRGTAFPMKR